MRAVGFCVLLNFINRVSRRPKARQDSERIPKKGVAGICLHDFGFLIEKERKKNRRMWQA
jgi:hypothetical protein